MLIKIHFESWDLRCRGLRSLDITNSLVYREETGARRSSEASPGQQPVSWSACVPASCGLRVPLAVTEGRSWFAFRLRCPAGMLCDILLPNH